MQSTFHEAEDDKPFSLHGVELMMKAKPTSTSGRERLLLKDRTQRCIWAVVDKNLPMLKTHRLYSFKTFIVVPVNGQNLTSDLRELSGGCNVLELFGLIVSGDYVEHAVSSPESELCYGPFSEYLKNDGGSITCTFKCETKERDKILKGRLSFLIALTVSHKAAKERTCSYGYYSRIDLGDNDCMWGCRRCDNFPVTLDIDVSIGLENFGGKSFVAVDESMFNVLLGMTKEKYMQKYMIDDKGKKPRILTKDSKLTFYSKCETPEPQQPRGKRTTKKTYDLSVLVLPDSFFKNCL